jgi:hypothetical protein
MIARAHNPFMGQIDWQHNACITNYMQFSELSRLYLRSGDTLVDISIEHSETMDVHVYAICFLYRHSVELLLKDLLWKSTYAAQGQKRFPKHHRLPELWRDLCKQINDLAGSDRPLTREQEFAVSELLNEVNKHDPESDGFRYPYDKKMKRSHPDLMHVNLPLLRDRFHMVIDIAYSLYELIDYHYDQK